MKARVKRMEIPKGHQTLMPYFIVDGAERFRDFIESVFNGTITYEDTAPDGKISHCEARIGDSTIMFGGSGGPWKPRTSDLFIYVNDADEVYKRALNNGATTVLEPQDKDYGRSCGVTDPFGNIWWITSVVPAK
jgi:PhnB protein